MIALQQLIEMAPFSDEVRKEILGKLSTLTDGQKYELTNLCWDSILQNMENTFQTEEAKILYEAAIKDGIDVGAAKKAKEDVLLEEFAKKLQSHVDVSDLSEAREELADITNEASDSQTN